ncbi:MAG: hypothetical protein LQ340_001974 [Diploschistes diacapsis]|nr:MAG: hypothetical protein LQ340_001974 [Diploschistes diacapsis]
MPPRHTRAGSSLVTATITVSPSINSLPRHHYSHSYLHNTSYGLLEPAPISIRPVPARPCIQHRRKSSGSSSSSAWSDWDFDLSDWKERSADLSGKIGDKLPGVKYSAGKFAPDSPASLCWERKEHARARLCILIVHDQRANGKPCAAFISTLRVNLALSTSLAPPSPNLLATSPGLPPSTKPLLIRHAEVSPSKYASGTDHLAGITSLDLEATQSSSDRTNSLKLISDYVSQQRSIASTMLVFHPLMLGLLAALTAAAYRFLVKDMRDLPLLFTTSISGLLCIVSVIRFMLRPYEELAKKINSDWLGDDRVIVARFGSTVIGTCVYRIEQVSRRKSHSGGTSGKRASIRAWTVRPRERGRGVGRGLLEKVVDVCLIDNGCEIVDFASAGLRAGADRVLPDWTVGGGLVRLNATFENDEARAEECLANVLQERGYGDKRRRGSR